MKISNFRLTGTHVGRYKMDKEFYATVDVETGYLWWKKTQEFEIRRSYGRHWYFVETGRYTPFYDVEELARSYTAKTGQET